MSFEELLKQELPRPIYGWDSSPKAWIINSDTYASMEVTTHSDKVLVEYEYESFDEEGEDTYETFSHYLSKGQVKHLIGVLLAASREIEIKEIKE